MKYPKPTTTINRQIAALQFRQIESCSYNLTCATCQKEKYQQQFRPTELANVCHLQARKETPYATTLASPSLKCCCCSFPFLQVAHVGMCRTGWTVPRAASHLRKSILIIPTIRFDNECVSSSSSNVEREDYLNRMHQGSLWQSGKGLAHEPRVWSHPQWSRPRCGRSRMPLE